MPVCQASGDGCVRDTSGGGINSRVSDFSAIATPDGCVIHYYYPYSVFIHYIIQSPAIHCDRKKLSSFKFDALNL